ncbi:MAG: hypothetical protein WKF94_19530 [Solirubrobacteraceae bacterium]
MKAIARTDAPVAIEGDGVELRVQPIGGGMRAGFVRLPKGADLRPAVVGLPDDPGHAPEALEDSEYVDFSPTDEFNHVLDHIRSQG